jgi:RHS repeat-associated protein
VVDALGNRHSYNYDADSNLVSETDAKGHTTEHEYDALNRLEVVEGSQGQTLYTYDAVGNRESVSYPSGNVTLYDYDALNRLTRLTTTDAADQIVADYAYTLGDTGRRMQVVESHNGRTTAYTYDELYRLTTETVTDPVNGGYSAEYQFDKVGNRTYSIIDGVHTAYSYDANDRLQQQGNTSYTYDANGNTLTETLDGGTKAYRYNAKNKLIAMEQGGVTTHYGYNADGIRTRKTEAGATTNFVVDSNRSYAQVLAEVTNSTTDVAYTYGDDLIAQTRNTDTSYYLYDGHGSTRALADSSGSLTDSYDYDAFGVELNSTGTTENAYRYTGEQYDANLDQYYLRARYYNQGAGRFTQMDTWMGRGLDPITLNKYLYGNADPVTYVDPTGKYSLGSVGSASNIAGQLAARNIASSGLRFTINRAITTSIKTSGKLITKNARRLVRKCLKKQNRCGLTIPTLIVGSDNYEAAQHIREAQTSLLAGRGFVLRYKNRPRSNIQRGKCGPFTPPGKDCDEYPFNRTAQGGPGNVVSFKFIDRSHNRRVGGAFGALVRMARLKTSKKKSFLVIAPNDSPLTVPLGFVRR